MQRFPPTFSRPSRGLLLTWVLLLGCGSPQEFAVTGVVTLNEKPLEAATISFLPKDESLVGAVARTSGDGTFRVEISTDRPGLSPGTYTVRISTYDEGDAEADPPLPPVRERVPRRYNEDSTLTVEVKAEENEFAFHLEK